MKPFRRVTRFVHIRVPGVPTVERMEKIRQQYQNGALNPNSVQIGIIDIAVDRPYEVGACYSCKDQAGADVQDVADRAEQVISGALPNSDPAILVTSARYVVFVTQQQAKGRRRKMVVKHTDDREAKERCNRSWFDTDLWSVQTYWRLKSWSRPRLAIYDYSGSDGRKVWSWVFHFGPWWFVRERYAL